jgi:hypothetical protein
LRRVVVSSNCLFLVNWIFHGCSFHLLKRKRRSKPAMTARNISRKVAVPKKAGVVRHPRRAGARCAEAPAAADGARLIARREGGVHTPGREQPQLRTSEGAPGQARGPPVTIRAWDTAVRGISPDVDPNT